MKRWVFIFLALTMTAGASEAKLPFWKAKEKVYSRIQNGEVIVSVMSVDPQPPFARRMTINGAGHVSAPRDFVFNYAQDFDQIARLSGYIESAKYDKDAGTIDLTIKALGFKSDITLSVKALKDEDPPRIDFRVIKGPLTGMENQISFADLPRAKTEVGILGNYSYDKFPIPKMFLEFGLEVVFQKMAVRLRQQAEAAYRAEGSKKMSFHEQRRFPRAVLKPSLAEVISSLAASVMWPNLETSDVLDLSYKGVAARKPGLFPVAVSTTAQVEVRLGADAPFKVTARVAWCNLDWVGLEFTELPPEGHASMVEFLDAKLMGAALRPVEKVFFSPGENFSYWFQGPSGVHVFVWLNSHRLIDRVNVDFGGESVHFERAAGSKNLSRLQRKALLVLSQMDKPDLPMEEFVRTIVSGA